MQLKIKRFQEAAEAFDYLAHINIQELSETLKDPRLIDGLQNGQAQKFEYTTELCWKAIKKYLFEVEGVDEPTPKRIIKTYFLAGHIADESDFLSLIEAIEDRNRLSHVYDHEVFLAILAKLPHYAEVFLRVANGLSNKIKPL